MTSLLLAEHDNTTLSPATKSTLTAALQLGDKVDLIILGFQCESVAQAAATLSGVQRVICIDAPDFSEVLAEHATEALMQCARDYRYILAPSTTFGKNILPRIAALLDVGVISDVIRILDPITFVRPIYAGNALSTVVSEDPCTILTIRTAAFSSTIAAQIPASIEQRAVTITPSTVQWLESQNSKRERPELSSARVVISGGRALQSAENFKLIEALADALHGAVGASRAAVDAGFVPNDYQVGQTGKVVAPELYIAVGISGAIQHLAGMKDSKVIVAINKDAEAPIFQIATYGLVGDLFEIIPKMIAELKK